MIVSFVYIGVQKTGTTAIQESLAGAYKSLLARGALYPYAGRGHLRQHLKFVEELAEGGGPATEVPSHLELLEEVRATEPTTLLISSESLGGIRPRAVAWARSLSDVFQPREALILGYVRPQWDYIESAYTQAVKNGSTWVPFREYLEDSLAGKKRSTI